MPVEPEGEDQVLTPPSDHVGPIPPGPPPSSDAPEDSTDPHGATDDGDGAEAESRATPVPEFDPRFRQAFDGLIHLGYLTDSFSWLGHDFTMRTLDVATILEVGLLHRQYVDTLADIKAYQTLVVAAATTVLDGKPIAVPVGADQSDLEQKFRVVRKWYPQVLDHLYERYLLLEKQVSDVMDAMGEAHGSTDSTPGLQPESV